ncbi:hypothetical protein X798_02665 [Onchocerca flexuosa]|uniref:Secreted protein n=1 Tax=Onchocerca flexuosa TaxID=387005 RepID=A0A238C0A6_9BILA|nr:hypothetical protein X798_02665 [Onchocerca flexuosa]
MKCSSGNGVLLFALFGAILSDAKSLRVGFDGAVNQEIPIRSPIHHRHKHISTGEISRINVVCRCIVGKSFENFSNFVNVLN